jgi:large conductance mechanosensitive channel
LQGNILELAIGIIIGTAFQSVVKSLVEDIITPPFGLIFDGVDFSNLTIEMHNYVRKGQPPVVIRYGIFLQQIIHLLVVALALFGAVKLIRRLRRIAAHNRQVAATSEPSTPSEPSDEVKLLREIRDLIAENKNATSQSSTTSPLNEPSSNLISI